MNKQQYREVSSRIRRAWRAIETNMDPHTAHCASGRAIKIIVCRVTGRTDTAAILAANTTVTQWCGPADHMLHAQACRVQAARYDAFVAGDETAYEEARAESRDGYMYRFR